MQFRTSSNNFTQLCEVENASTPFSPSWSISHDRVKFSHNHAKSVFTFPLVCCNQSLFCFISHDCVNFLHVHAKLKNRVFQLFFAISSISSFWFHFNYLQILIQTDCIASFIMHLDHHRFICFFNLIHLFCHQFIKNIPWNDSKTS